MNKLTKLLYETKINLNKSARSGFALVPAAVAVTVVAALGLALFAISKTISLPGKANTTLPPSVGGTFSPGIYAVREYKEKKDKNFSDATYQNPNITGLALRISWKAIEPVENQYDWTQLDELFTKAASNNKKVSLIIVSGFDSPDWVINSVQTADFPRKYGRGAGEHAKLPIPWDQSYLSKWYAFLTAVSTRYSQKSEFAMVSVDGPSSVSAEMSLPNTDSDVQQWLTLGYRPHLFINAWQQIFTNFAKLFPHQYLSLALYPGLPINESGQIDQNASATTRQAIIDLGVNNYVSHFALQTSGLHAGPGVGGGGYDIVLSYNGQIATGFQMSTSATKHPDKMGDAGNPANALKMSIDKGLTANDQGKIINYLEIYEPDILNPQMQSVLAEAQKKLTNGSVSSGSGSSQVVPPPTPRNRGGRLARNSPTTANSTSTNPDLTTEEPLNIE